MKVAFVYAGGRESRWEKTLRGDGPTDFFYGAIEMARAGHDVMCLDAPDPRRSMLAEVYNRLWSGRSPVRTRGEHVEATRRLLGRLRDREVVVAASTSHANALGWWQAWGRVPARLVGIHCGHVNYPIEGARRQATVAAMARQRVVLFADSEREETIRSCGVSASQVHANAYGIDVDFWTPGTAPVGDYILSVGNDGRRDYDTLVAAVAGTPWRTRILTRRPLPDLPAHVENLRGSWHAPTVTDEELRELYRGALAVIVPLEDSIQPSGQSVALQAMACGRPVILSRTRGLWTGGDMIDGSDLLLVEPGSAAALRAAMESLLLNPERREAIGRNARQAVLRHGRIADFARRLEAVCTNPDS